MPMYLNIPTYNTTIQASSVAYQNQDVQNVTNVKQMLDSLQSGKVTVEAGKGLSSNDFTNSYKQQLDNMKNQLMFSSYAEFPTIGEIDTLYIDKTKNAMYLYDTVNKVYKPIIVDTEQENYIIQSIL